MDYETNLLPQPEALWADGDAPAGQKTAVSEGFPAVAAPENAAVEASILLEPRSEYCFLSYNPL